MSSFNRRSFLLAPLALAACGFEPALAPGGAGAILRSQIHPRDPKERAEFLFVRAFEERMGDGAGGAYAMDYQIVVKRTGLAITPAQETTRFNLIGNLAFTISDRNGAVLTKGSVENFTSYSATGTNVASLTAERAARARLVTILTDQLITRLTATSGGWAR